MNRRIWIAPIAFLTSLLLASGCSIMRPSESGRATHATLATAGGVEGVFVQSEDGEGCPDPFEGFDEAMLIGTWQAGFGDSTDTLVFREDGFYKQVTRVESLDFYMESDWQRWRVSYGLSQIPHLHLEGMRLCVPYHLPDCEFKGGGEVSWWDFCEDQMVRMPNEGILLAMGVPNGFVAPPRGFSLVSLTRDPDSSGFSYQLEN